MAYYTPLANVKGSQIASIQYKTLHEIQAIATTLTNQTGFIICSEKTVNPHNTKNIFCLDSALIQVKIPVIISILLEKMFLVVKDNFPEIPAAVSQGP